MKSYKKNLLIALSTAAFASAAFAHGGAEHPISKKKPVLSVEERSFGREGNPKEVVRTVNIEMSDTMRFSPASIQINQGDTVRFVVKNNGVAMHEMVLGTMGELKEHGDLMKRFPGMEHDEPYMAHVAPGKSEEIVWRFTKPGQFNFGCLIPGHFESGMVGSVEVKRSNS